MTINKIEIVESDLSVVVTSPGPQGTAGKTVLGGGGVPSDELGIDGDFYIDTTASDIYGPKANDSWGSPRSLLGAAATIEVGTTTSVPNSGTASVTNSGTTNAATFDFVLRDGADGNSVLSGSGVPSAGLGVDGDFYIDTSSDTIYGPKAGGAWGSPTSLIGPKGNPGPGVASGGTVGQVLVKSSSIEYATAWGDAISSGISVPDGATASVLGLPGVTIHSIGSISLADGLTQLYGPFFVDSPIDVTECAIEVTTPWAGGTVSLHLIQADEEWQPINGTDVTVAASVDCSTAGIKLVAGLSLNLERGRWLTVLKETVDGAGTLRGFSGSPPGVSFFSDTFSAIDASGFWRKLSPASLADKWSRATFDIDDRGFQQAMLLKWYRPFSVLDSVNPVVWYDASDAATITESVGLVSQWDDKSVNGQHLTQATSSYQPRTSARTMNGLNVLDFDGGDSLKVTFGETVTQPTTIFAVFEYDSGNYVYDGLDVSNRQTLFISSGNYNIFAGATVRGGSADGNPHISRAVFNGVSSSLFIDGSSIATGNVGSHLLGGLAVGTRFSDTNNLNGAIAELMVVDGVLTGPLISDIETYLANKWGIGPGKVGVVTAVGSNGEVLLSWSAPASILPMTDYIVEYSTDDVNWTTFVDAVSAATSVTVTGLTNDTLYYFRVAAVNNGGTGAFSDSVTATPVFSPLDLSPTLWLDASDETTITESGGAVSQWDDKSTNGNDFVQAAAASQPTSGTRTINTLNTLDFDGTSDFLQNDPSPFAASQPYTLFVVAQRDTDVYGRVLTQLSPPVLAAFNSVDRTFTGAGSFIYGASGDAPLDTPLIVRVAFNGASSSAHIDGVQTVSGDFGTNNFETSKAVRIGAYESGLQNFNGTIGEIIFVEGTLTAQQISDTETYLTNKWIPVPIQLNATAWYDASDTSTITESSGSVSQWDDLSGNGYHLTQATGSAQPKTGTATINGLNTIEYDGSNTQWLTNASVPIQGTTSYTLFAVYEIPNPDGRYILYNTSDQNGGAYIAQSGSTSTVLHLAMSDPSLYVDGTQFTGTNRDDVFQATSLNAPVLVRVTATSNTYNGVSFGRAVANAFAFGSGTKVAEAFLLEDPAPADVATAEQYLADKWGITL